MDGRSPVGTAFGGTVIFGCCSAVNDTTLQTGESGVFFLVYNRDNPFKNEG